jgi:hypothetical protein
VTGYIRVLFKVHVLVYSAFVSDVTVMLIVLWLWCVTVLNIFVGAEAPYVSTHTSQKHLL